MEGIGKKIKDLRKQKGLTQRELGELLHVSFQAVSKWERGESLPDTAMFGEVAQVLGVSVDDLFYSNGDISSISGEGASKPTVIVKTEIVEKPVYKSVNRAKYIIITAFSVALITVLSVIVSNMVIKKNQALEKLSAVSSAYLAQSNVKIDCREGDNALVFIRKYYFDGRVVLYFADGEMEKYYYEGAVYQRAKNSAEFSKSAGEEREFLASIPQIFNFDLKKDGVKSIKQKDGGIYLSLKNGEAFSTASALGFTDKAILEILLDGGLPKKLVISEGKRACEISYVFGYGFTFTVPKF